MRTPSSRLSGTSRRDGESRVIGDVADVVGLLHRADRRDVAHLLDLVRARRCRCVAEQLKSSRTGTFESVQLLERAPVELARRGLDAHALDVALDVPLGRRRAARRSPGAASRSSRARAPRSSTARDAQLTIEQRHLEQRRRRVARRRSRPRSRATRLHGGSSPSRSTTSLELARPLGARLDDLVDARVAVQRGGLGRHLAEAEATVVLEAQKESRASHRCACSARANWSCELDVAGGTR